MNQHYFDVMMKDMIVEFNELSNMSESELKNKSLAELKMLHYKTIYKISSSGYKNIKENLVIKFQVMLTQHLSRYTDLGFIADDAQLDQLFSIWSHYKFLLKWNLFTFSYFSRIFQVDLETTGVTIFLERIWRKCALSVFSFVLRQLRIERKGGQIDIWKVASALSFGTMSQEGDFVVLYEEKLIKPFIAQVLQDEEELISELDSSCSSSEEFFRSLVGALKAEEDRCAVYFPHNRQEGILNVVKEFIRCSAVAQQRLRSSDGLLLSFENGDTSMLRIYFNLFFSDSSSVFSNAFREVVEKIADDVQSSATSPPIYAKEILELRKKSLNTVKDCFRCSPDVAGVIRSTFAKIFDQKTRSKDSSRMVNFWYSFATLVDCGLRSLVYREYIDEDSLSVLSSLHDAAEIVNMMAENMLQRALDPECFFQVDIEKHFVEMVSKCIGNRIPLLESIVIDMESSNAFFSSVKEDISVGEMSFVALRRSNWIATRLNGPEIRIPECISTKLNALHQQYVLATRNRTFKWCHHSSSAVLEAKFLPQDLLTLYVSASQAIMLLSLNDHDHICFGKLINAHNFLRETIVAEIEYFVHRKLLVKESNFPCNCCSSHNSEERYVLNEQFTHKDPFLSLIRWLRRDSGEVREEKQSKLARWNGVDATIVKNLKKKSDTLENLMKFCQESLRYTVASSLVKSRIEELIRKGYVIRDSEDLSKFSYLR